LRAVWRASARHRKPVVIHCRPEPCIEGYGVDTRSVSGAARLRKGLDRHPDAIVIVPHLGFDAAEEFEKILGEFPNLHPEDEEKLLSGNALRLF
jgi:hypothetical protein